MFYHAYTHDRDILASRWIAYHGPTLTPMRITVGPPTRAVIELLPLPPPPAETSAECPFDPVALTAELGSEIKTHISPPLRTMRFTTATAKDFQIPEYLVGYAADGSSPVIIRTQDPRFIIPVEAGGTLSAKFSHFACATSLSVQGWAYWWEDAAIALDQFNAALSSLK